MFLQLKYLFLIEIFSNHIVVQVTKRPILRSLTSPSSSSVLSRRFSTPKSVSCQLFLFQKTLMLCKTSENLSEPNNPHLLYDCHIR